MRTLVTTLCNTSPNCELLDVIGETDRAFKVRNQENGSVCYIPKSGLKLRKPGVPTYEDDFVLAKWFRDSLNRYQERTLGVSE